MALSYKEAGVDKEQGYKEVGLIKKFIKETYTPPTDYTYPFLK